MGLLVRGAKALIGMVGTGVNIFCIGHCAFEYGAELTFLTGPSMIPTFNGNSHSNVVLTEHVSSRWKALSKGDVVIARSPMDPKTFVCKRVAAVAGDSVPEAEGVTFKRGFGINEVPHGHVWLLGDNPDNSTDSRMYGPVPIGLVRGKVLMKVWPFSEVGFVE